MTFVGQVDIHVDGTPIVHITCYGNVVDNVVVRAGSTIACNSALVSIESHLNVVALCTDARTPVVLTILAIHGHEAIGARCDARAKYKLTVGMLDLETGSETLITGIV